MPRDRVRIKFSRDVRSSDRRITYTKDSEWLVDAVTADGLLLVGAAVKVAGSQADSTESGPQRR